MREVLLAITSIVSSIIVLIALILFGWYIVWILILSRFKFVRELLGGGLSDSSAITSEARDGRSRVKKARRD